MGQKVPPVKGTRDVLPGDTYLKKDDPWIRTGHLHLIEQTARELFPLYGYREARTPVLERTALFARGIGDATDIVAKEMYTFEDRDGTQVSMRPEGTASLVRAYVEHAVQQQEPETKWWYAGPMFRHERQQRGRYRQFTQIGVEAFGSPGPRIDAEQIEMLDRWLRMLGVPFEMHVNTLGDAQCRPAYRGALQKYLRAHASELCEDCRKRTETNPIRVLDCKNPECQRVAAGAPKMDEFLCAACREHFDGVRRGLDALGVAHVVDPKLVRGLDYYMRTTYEAIATSGLGSQSTVAGGGRYDGLVRELGGGDVPGIGFAAGVERLALLVAQAGRELAVRPVVFFVPLGPEEESRADVLAQQLRTEGIAAEVSFRRSSPGNQMKRADALGARFALVLGDAELKSGRAKLKEMKTGAEHEVALADLPGAVRKLSG
jgi:histidyl-tRNA synthetase